MFKYRDRAAGTEVELSVFEYFKKIYNIELQHWWLPLIVTERAGMFPMEMCTLSPNQRYNFKLSPDQVSFPSPPKQIQPLTSSDRQHDQVCCYPSKGAHSIN